MSAIRFTTFPLTVPPLDFVTEIVGVLNRHEQDTCTKVLEAHLKSDEVLHEINTDLTALGFDSKKARDGTSGVFTTGIYCTENSTRYNLPIFHSDKCFEISAVLGGLEMPRPLLLDLLEPVVVDFDTTPSGEYDEEAQIFCYSDSDPSMGGTSRTQSMQNSTTAPSVVTGCEDYDDEYVTRPD